MAANQMPARSALPCGKVNLKRARTARFLAAQAMKGIKLAATQHRFQSPLEKIEGELDLAEAKGQICGGHDWRSDRRNLCPRPGPADPARQDAHRRRRQRSMLRQQSARPIDGINPLAQCTGAKTGQPPSDSLIAEVGDPSILKSR